MSQNVISHCDEFSFLKKGSACVITNLCIFMLDLAEQYDQVGVVFFRKNVIISIDCVVLHAHFFIDVHPCYKIDLIAQLLTYLADGCTYCCAMFHMSRDSEMWSWLDPKTQNINFL